ncbi:MAG: hypothetical protein J7647_11475 [Cyanobacteria bacterium SBLK]|nr:hypothetical protein [Cyanobacteria bacterium SBLK]
MGDFYHFPKFFFVNPETFVEIGGWGEGVSGASGVSGVSGASGEGGEN